MPTTAAAPAQARPTLPALDVPAITARETADVDRALARQRTAESRLKTAAKIIADAEPGLDVLRATRGRMGVLAVAAGVRPSVTHRAMGVGRTRLYDLMGEHTDASARFTDDYADLPRVAEQVVAAEARIKAAESHRDDAMRELRAAGWTRDRIAAIIGRNPSRVSHVAPIGE